MSEKKTYPELCCADRAAWDAWLSKHNATSSGVRLVFGKKGSGVVTVTPFDAVEVALTWGWIDGQANRRDEHTFCLRFTHRTPKSIWSKINRERVTALIAAKKMHPSGLAEVERARADGRWDRAYDSPRTAQVPEDLAKALAKNARARKAFESLDATNRYAILHRLHNTVKPETRARRLDLFVGMLERGELHHPDRARKSPPKSKAATGKSTPAAKKTTGAKKMESATPKKAPVAKKPIAKKPAATNKPVATNKPGARKPVRS